MHPGAMFGRKKQTTVAAAPSNGWQISSGEREGRPISTRFNAALARAADRRDYGIQIGVAVPLVDPDPWGLPRGGEFAQLDAIEDVVVATAGDRAVLVGVITTAAMREFVLYTGDGGWIADFHQSVQAQIDHHEIQVMAQTDPDWQVFALFVPR